jgi:hypothetical protein
MNEATQVRTKSEYTVTIDTETLIAATALLEQIHAAARAGGLDWEDRSIHICMTFSDGVQGQTIAPLEEVLARQDNIFGVTCTMHRTPLD